MKFFNFTEKEGFHFWISTSDVELREGKGKWVR